MRAGFLQPIAIYLFVTGSHSHRGTNEEAVPEKISFHIRWLPRPRFWYARNGWRYTAGYHKRTGNVRKKQTGIVTLGSGGVSRSGKRIGNIIVNIPPNNGLVL